MAMQTSCNGTNELTLTLTTLRLLHNVITYEVHAVTGCYMAYYMCNYTVTRTLM